MIKNCEFCGGNLDRNDLRFEGKPICALCGHKKSHNWPLPNGCIPTPVTDGDGNIIPRGVYPNIDWT